MCAVCVSRAQQESQAHEDREDQRLVFLTRALRSTIIAHLLLKWTFTKTARQKSSVRHSEILNICSFLFSRAHEEREVQGDQREKLDQRWVTYFLSLNFVLLFSFNSSFGPCRVTLEMMAHQDLQGRGCVPLLVAIFSFYGGLWRTNYSLFGF